MDEKGAEVAEEIEVDGKAAPSRNPKHLLRNRRRPPALRIARHLKHLLKLMMLLFAGFVPSLSSITPYLNAIIGPAMYAVLGCVLCTRNSSVHSARYGVSTHSSSIRLVSLCFYKHPQEDIVFTESPDKPFEEFDITGISFKDTKLSIYFETQEIMEESLLLLRFNCPVSDCPFIASGWGDLKIHVRAAHGKQMWCVGFGSNIMTY